VHRIPAFTEGVCTIIHLPAGRSISAAIGTATRDRRSPDCLLRENRTARILPATANMVEVARGNGKSALAYRDAARCMAGAAR
jgi:hypothetical protein